MGTATLSRDTPAVATRLPGLAVLRVLRLTGVAVRLFTRPALVRAVRGRWDERELAVRLRRLLEAGGVTTVKIGQYLAIRRDLFSAATCAELSRLLDAVPPMPIAQVEAIVAAEIGTPVAARFAWFDPVPIGAASIAQVHRGRLHDGRVVAVKVQRAGIAATMTADFGLFAALAACADALGLSRGLGLRILVDEVAAFTLRETDFRIEAQTADRIAADPRCGVHVPRIHWDLSTGRLLVMELIDGLPLARAIGSAAAGGEAAAGGIGFAEIAPGIRSEAIVERLAAAFLRQLFVTGLFHGDPHPGNVLIERDGTIALIDYGIFGTISDADRRVLTAYVENLALGRIGAAFDCYTTLVTIGPGTDWRRYRHDTIALLAAWHGAAADPATPVHLQLTAYYQGRMFTVMRRHGVRMGPDHLLFWRALAILDSTAHQLPGRFDLLGAVRRFFADVRPGAALRAGRAATGLGDYARLAGGEVARAIGATARRTTIPVAAALPRADGLPVVAVPLAALALGLHAAALPAGVAVGAGLASAALAVRGMILLWREG